MFDAMENYFSHRHVATFVLKLTFQSAKVGTIINIFFTHFIDVFIQVFTLLQCKAVVKRSQAIHVGQDGNFKTASIICTCDPQL